MQKKKNLKKRNVALFRKVALFLFILKSDLFTYKVVEHSGRWMICTFLELHLNKAVFQ
jgi:hypothetical protein